MEACRRTKNQGNTVNKKYYLEVLRRLREAIHQKRTELGKKFMDFASR